MSDVDKIAKDARRILDNYRHGPQETELWYAAVEAVERTIKRGVAAALRAEREAVAAKFAAFADEKGDPRKVLGYKPSPLVPLAEFVRLAELLDDYAMGGNRVSATLPDIVAQMNHTANTARLHL